jgi:SAM-dependent methyltransferase
MNPVIKPTVHRNLIPTTDTRATIVQLMRGRFVTPVLAKLGAIGMLDRLMSEPISILDYPQFNPHVLRSLMGYLAAVGLVELTSAGEWRASGLGGKVFQRWGAFSILNSYEDYFSQLDGLLQSAEKPAHIAVDRVQNVVGSGQLHARKFFPAALGMLAGTPPDVFVDIGCGDGTFLGAALHRYPEAKVVAVDFSSEAVDLTHTRLASRIRHGWCGVVADGADVDKWSAHVPRGAQRIVVTAWFVLHEFCQGSVEQAREFLLAVRKRLPGAEIVIGEVVRAHSSVLAKQCARSALPEFQLFHALSGQGLLSWDQFGKLRADMPYHIKSERLIDPVLTNAGSVPSNLIWHLLPS